MLNNKDIDNGWKLKQRHPTRDFGKISVRIAGCLKISIIFPSEALSYSFFSENRQVSPELSELTCSLLYIMSRFSLPLDIFVCRNYSKASKSFGDRSS